MNTAIQIHDVPATQVLRGVGRVSAAILFCAWLALFISELVQRKVVNPSGDEFVQLAMLAVVFAGYAIGWRHELVGGLLAVLGTIAFLVAVYTLNLPLVAGIGAVTLFALPGVLYLLTWNLDRLRAKHIRG